MFILKARKTSEIYVAYHHDKPFFLLIFPFRDFSEKCIWGQWLQRAGWIESKKNIASLALPNYGAYFFTFIITTNANINTNCRIYFTNPLVSYGAIKNKSSIFDQEFLLSKTDAQIEQQLHYK